MTDFPTKPPRSKNQLFDRIRTVIDHGPYHMPEGSRYQGTGAAGMFLEDLLGLTAGAMDIPDAVGWEMKWLVGLRNHGTKFRISRLSTCRLYLKKERL